MGNRVNLGVNVDHIATLRQARGVDFPDPVDAALIAEKAGANSITMHLREDRRHIQDADIYNFSKVMGTHLNLEMAITKEMIEIASDLKPRDCCLVPEKREELTTEGGLNVKSNYEQIKEACHELTKHGIRVSLFIDPDITQIEAASSTGATVIELHTGAYADSESHNTQNELKKIKKSTEYAYKKGLIVHAGHGLNYDNVKNIASINEIMELNIGHSIVSQAAFIGMDAAVKKMVSLLSEARV